MLACLALLAATIQNPLNPGGRFPIAVWLQDPAMAPRYKAAGINLYVGLWQGPTEAQLSALKQAGMPVICDQNAVGLKHIADPAIVAWMHGDEPDNAQPAPGGGYGPCVPPQRIVDTFRAIKAKDSKRPVLLNLGQGVANDTWIGRGSGAKLSDYETYVQGCDIVSFDVYPVAGLQRPDQIGLVAKGVDRLMKWTSGKKQVWNCLECTNIDGKAKPTPAQVAAEAWSALLHGSRGLIYFVHQFRPSFNEHALLDDPQMLAGVTALNGQIQRYAPLLDDPVAKGVTFASGSQGVEFKATQRGNLVTCFALAMNGEAHCTLRGPSQAIAHDLTTGEDLRMKEGSPNLRLEPLKLHIIRLSLP